jgi:hypothetical protein
VETHRGVYQENHTVKRKLDRVAERAWVSVTERYLGGNPRRWRRRSWMRSDPWAACWGDPGMDAGACFRLYHQGRLLMALHTWGCAIDEADRLEAQCLLGEPVPVLPKGLCVQVPFRPDDCHRLLLLHQIHPPATPPWLPAHAEKILSTTEPTEQDEVLGTFAGWHEAVWEAQQLAALELPEIGCGRYMWREGALYLDGQPVPTALAESSSTVLGRPLCGLRRQLGEAKRWYDIDRDGRLQERKS